VVGVFWAIVEPEDKRTSGNGGGSIAWQIVAIVGRSKSVNFRIV